MMLKWKQVTLHFRWSTCVKMNHAIVCGCINAFENISLSNGRYQPAEYGTSAVIFVT